VRVLTATVGNIADEFDTELCENVTPEPADHNRVFTLACQPKRKAKSSPKKEHTSSLIDLSEEESANACLNAESGRRKSARLNTTTAVKGGNNSDVLDGLVRPDTDTAQPRLNTHQNYCCFDGYRWCCYAEGCIEHLRCRRDIRVHFRDKCRSQFHTFVYAKMVKRTVEEAEVWSNRFHEEQYIDDEEA
jgi:hypothetical protein